MADTPNIAQMTRDCLDVNPKANTKEIMAIIKAKHEIEAAYNTVHQAKTKWMDAEKKQKKANTTSATTTPFCAATSTQAASTTLPSAVPPPVTEVSIYEILVVRSLFARIGPDGMAELWDALNPKIDPEGVLENVRIRQQHD